MGRGCQCQAHAGGARGQDQDVEATVALQMILECRNAGPPPGNGGRSVDDADLVKPEFRAGPLRDKRLHPAMFGEDQHPLAAGMNAAQDAADRIEPCGPREVDLQIILHRVGRLGMKRDATDVVKQLQRGTASTIHEVLSGKLVGLGLD